MKYFLPKIRNKTKISTPTASIQWCFSFKTKKEKNRGEGRGEDNIFNATWDIYCILHYVKSHCLRNMNRCKKCSHLIGYIIHQRTWIFNFLTMWLGSWRRLIFEEHLWLPSLTWAPWYIPCAPGLSSEAGGRVSFPSLSPTYIQSVNRNE